VPEFAINPFPKLFGVSRMFLSQTYGGSTQTLVIRVPPRKNPSSTPENPKPLNILCPTEDINPSMPERPGRPGILFTNRQEMLQDQPWSVFRRSITSPAALWEYLGQYRSTLVGSISGDQFRVQNEKVNCCLSSGVSSFTTAW
jgi:hypothetical protein